jgi:photosystem II stability/assembly factor-like uncharacterized protein
VEKSFERPETGPPPPGYIKILGEAVPGWTRAEMNRAAQRGALAWEALGPKPIKSEFWSGNDDASGRVVSIAVHPTEVNTAYIASASGGIWKTTDGGSAWTPLTDELPNLNHGCVALDPSDPDTVYAATGEYTTGANGDGLFYSADAGATWDRLATAAEVGSRCSQLIIDPNDPLVIHVSGQGGYVRSADGGVTWSNTLTGRVSDLAMHPTDSDTLFAGRHGQGVYRSEDGGLTWVPLAGGLPSINFSRILVDTAASAPDTVFATMITPNASLEGLYRSVDNGDTWSKLANTPNFPSPQGWYSAFFGVDPANASILYAGGVFPTYAVAGVTKSIDGGASWNDITMGVTGGQLHPDMQAIAFGSDGAVWVANDGGVWKSQNGGQSWINLNATLALTQNYAIAVDPTNADRVMGGTQDNGSVGRESATMDWPQIFAGDGGFLTFDFDQPARFYVTFPRLAVVRRNPSGSANTITGPWGGDPKNFIAPMVMDPNDSNTLLAGTNRIWRTSNASAGVPTWTAISTSEVVGGAGGTLNAIAVAPGASDTIYTGSTNSRVFVTTDASVWVDRSAGLPNGQVSDLAVSPNDPGSAFVGFHNINGPRVLKTEDFGVTWEDVTGDLPGGVSARALAVDWPFGIPVLYAGSGVGVYSSVDGGATWIKDGPDLPNVNIGDLWVDLASGYLYAGTYGRGSWRAPLLTVEDIFADGFETGGFSRWASNNP